MNLFSMVSVSGYANMMIVNNSKINVNFGIFKSYTTVDYVNSQLFSIFTLYNSSLMLENTIFSNFASQIIDFSIGFIGINKCIFTNVILSSHLYIIQLETNVSFHINNSQFQNLGVYCEVKINNF